MNETQENDLRPELVLQPQMPALPFDNHVNLFNLVSKEITNLGRQARKAFGSCFQDLSKAGAIKRFQDLSTKYSSRQPFCQIQRPGLYYLINDLDQLELEDLAYEGFVQCTFVYFEIVIPKTGPFASPKPVTKYTDSSPFLNLPDPWNLLISLWSFQTQKTQDKLRFGGTLRLEFPLVDSVEHPNLETCEHDFLLRSSGTCEWRLVWECKLCGYMCRCSCFEKAIRNRPFSAREMGRYREEWSIPVNQLPFEENACEVCRGVPSTHEYCHEMYARSLFERRYGAYVEKRLAERGIDFSEKEEYEAIKREVTNQVREELGFRRIGEGFVNETELFRIVEAIFPDDEVIHHYRDQWLQGLELDIYVPDRRLGIEYHGIQHFQPIPGWGGEKALEEGKKRDAKKIRLCEDNDVVLVGFTYEEDLSLAMVKNRISQTLHKGFR